MSEWSREWRVFDQDASTEIALRYQLKTGWRQNEFRSVKMREVQSKEWREKDPERSPVGYQSTHSQARPWTLAIDSHRPICVSTVRLKPRRKDTRNAADRSLQKTIITVVDIVEGSSRKVKPRQRLPPWKQIEQLLPDARSAHFTSRWHCMPTFLPRPMLAAFVSWFQKTWPLTSTSPSRASRMVSQFEQIRLSAVKWTRWADWEGQYRSWEFK